VKHKHQKEGKGDQDPFKAWKARLQKNCLKKFTNKL
jgi:hypothetical protein